MQTYQRLLSPILIAGRSVKNRTFFAQHGTGMAQNGSTTDRHIAYHQARAEEGVGMIVTEPHAAHPTAFQLKWLSACDDGCIPGLRKLAAMCKRYDCRLIGAVHHPGRGSLLRREGGRQTIYGVSEIPEERCHQVPVEMPDYLIHEIIESFGDAAIRFREAEMDGIEIGCQYGYLIAQFLNPRTNHRNDEWGGSPENRLRFLRAVIANVRKKIGRDILVGLRISADEMDHDGLTNAEIVDLCRTIDRDRSVDYLSFTAGTGTSNLGWLSMVPPAPAAAGLLGPYTEKVKQVTSLPVMVAGRINQPQIAESILQKGQADMIGMVRTLIADPAFVRKTAEGKIDDIRACIGCNQACIGHRMAGNQVSCIQYPESGREAKYLKKVRSATPKRIMVIGGGPGGMKAAAVAAERGHTVALYEREARLGGQVLLAQMLPGRAEFGGLVTNLARELKLSGVRVERNVNVTAAFVQAEKPDRVILAAGAKPWRPRLEGIDAPNVIDSADVLLGRKTARGSVIVVDWRCDWIGLGLAEQLAREGCRVRLCVNGIVAGELLEAAVRDRWIGEIHNLGVEMIPYVRLFGVDGSSVYLQHMINSTAVIFEDVDAVILAAPRSSERRLANELHALGIPTTLVGDAASPRTAEEAILEGLEAAMAV